MGQWEVLLMGAGPTTASASHSSRWTSAIRRSRSVIPGTIGALLFSELCLGGSSATSADGFVDLVPFERVRTVSAAVELTHMASNREQVAYALLVWRSGIADASG
jgi:hypothetical protein